MLLSKLIECLRRVPGSGCPVAYQTPDGKKYQPVKVTTEQTFEGEGRVETIIMLEEVEPVITMVNTSPLIRRHRIE